MAGGCGAFMQGRGRGQSCLGGARAELFPAFYFSVCMFGHVGGQCWCRGKLHVGMDLHEDLSRSGTYLLVRGWPKPRSVIRTSPSCTGASRLCIMAKPRPVLSLERMAGELGYHVDPAAHPHALGRLYSDLTPVPVDLCGKTRREYEAYGGLVGRPRRHPLDDSEGPLLELVRFPEYISLAGSNEA